MLLVLLLNLNININIILNVQQPVIWPVTMKIFQFKPEISSQNKSHISTRLNLLPVSVEITQILSNKRI